MKNLKDKHCKPCEGGVEALGEQDARKLLANLDKDWEIDPTGKEIRKNFSFNGFYKTMAFVNAVAWIANHQGHHPDLEVGYGHCLVRYTTHAIDGISENDFICAAQIDALDA